MNVIEGRNYKHLVKGTEYRVLLVGKMEADEAPVVIYTESGNPDATVWVRPLGEFKQKFERVGT